MSLYLIKKNEVIRFIIIVVIPSSYLSYKASVAFKRWGREIAVKMFTKGIITL